MKYIIFVFGNSQKTIHAFFSTRSKVFLFFRAFDALDSVLCLVRSKSQRFFSL